MMLFVGMMVGIVSTLVVYCAYILIIAFTLWMAIDAGKQDRFWWMVLVLGVPIIGSVAYYYTEKKHEYALAPSHHIHKSETENEHEKTPKKLIQRRKKPVATTEKVEEEKVEETQEKVTEGT